jgi:hypothetical protein
MRAFWIIVGIFVFIFSLTSILISPPLRQASACLYEEEPRVEEISTELEKISNLDKKHAFFCTKDAESFNRLKACINEVKKQSGSIALIIELFPGFHSRMIDSLEQHNRLCKNKLSYP